MRWRDGGMAGLLMFRGIEVGAELVGVQCGERWSELKVSRSQDHLKSKKSLPGHLPFKFHGKIL